MKKQFVFPIGKESLSNILQFDDPHSFRCRIIYIHPLHRGTRIQISRQSSSNLPFEHFYLSLSLVKYFDGPMQWDGANFELAPLDELASLLSRLHGASISATDLISSQNCLLKLQTHEFLIRILCHNRVSISEDMRISNEE